MDGVATTTAYRTIFIVVVGVLVSGCVAERISPSNTDWSVSTVPRSDALRPLSVAIEPLEGESPISWTFTKGVRGADVFGSVESLHFTDKSPDIILSNYKHVTDFPGTGFQCWDNSATFLTIGIVPVICEESHSISFEARNAQGQSIQIRGEFKRTRMFGWIALLSRMSSNWSMHDYAYEWRLGPAYDEYMRDLLLSQADEIAAIAGQSS